MVVDALPFDHRLIFMFGRVFMVSVRLASSGDSGAQVRRTKAMMNWCGWLPFFNTGSQPSHKQ